MKGRKLSQHVVNRAEVLYKRGYTLQKIAEKLNVSFSGLRKYSINGQWADDILPNFTLDDIVEDLQAILFLHAQNILIGEVEDLHRSSSIIRNIAITVRELADLAPGFTAKNSVNVMIDAMKWAAQDFKASEDLQGFLKIAQAYHNKNVDALQD